MINSDASSVEAVVMLLSIVEAALLTVALAIYRRRWRRQVPPVQSFFDVIGRYDEVYHRDNDAGEHASNTPRRSPAPRGPVSE